MLQGIEGGAPPFPLPPLYLTTNTIVVGNTEFGKRIPHFWD